MKRHNDLCECLFAQRSDLDEQQAVKKCTESGELAESSVGGDRNRPIVRTHLRMVRLVVLLIRRPSLDEGSKSDSLSNRTSFKRDSSSRTRTVLVAGGGAGAEGKMAFEGSKAPVSESNLRGRKVGCQQYSTSLK